MAKVNVPYLVHSFVGKRGLINSTFGIVPTRQFCPSGLVSFGARGKHQNFLGCTSLEVSGGSIGFSYEDAVLGTIGEYVERLSGASIDWNDIIYSSYDKLILKGFNALHPDLLSLYAPWQYDQTSFPFKKLTATDEIAWVNGKDVSNKDDIYLPAFLVYLCDFPDSSGARYTNGTSTGLSANLTIEAALEGGVLEILERHAFCDFWYNQNKKDFIVYDARAIINSFERDVHIKKLFSNERVNIKVFDLGRESIVESVVVFMFFEYKGEQLFSIGSAAKFNKKDALLKACLEAYQGIEYLIGSYKKSELNTIGPAVSEIDSFDKHFFFYNIFPHLRSQSPILCEAEFTSTSTSQLMTVSGKAQSISELQSLDEGKINHLFYVDLTPKHLESLPFKTVKVIAPEFALLTGLHVAPFLGHQIFSDNTNLFCNWPHCFP